MIRVLITGARGFVGRTVLQPLLDAGAELHATMSAPDVPAELAALPVAWHHADLRASGVGARLIDEVRPTHVLHAAWVTDHGKYWTSDENLLWVAATAELIHAFGRASGQRFVLAGTCAEYDWSYGFLSEEVAPERPHTLYGTSKLAAHKLLMAAAREYRFSAATGRIFFAYGPYENAQRIIPYACRTLARGEEARFSSGTQFRDFMHVDDVGRGFAKLLLSGLDGACNVSSGSPVALIDIVKIIGAIAGASDRLRFGALADRPDDPPLIVGDSRKLRSLGWSPEIDLTTGLKETFAWWLTRADA